MQTFKNPFELSLLNGANGFIIKGIAIGDYAGKVSGAGDVNADGVNDLIVGAAGASPNSKQGAGQAYVIFGSMIFLSPLELSSLNGTNGFTINGINAGDNAGYSVSGVGDINADGIDDIAIGSPWASPNGKNRAGQAYVIFGSKNFSSPLELYSLNGATGFIINGIAADDWAGRSISGVGDVNADGINDLIIGAWNASPNSKQGAGQAYVVLGSKSFSSPFELSNLNGANGFIINGIVTNDEAGISVSGAGDMNADGISDVIIGAWWASPNLKNLAGQAYIIFGDKNFSSPFELSSLNGANGFILNGIVANDNAGISVRGALDINADGVDDIIIGAHQASPNSKSNAGQVYVVYGTKKFSSPLELSSLNGTNGFIINGIAANDQIGNSITGVSGAGDLNADGINDIIIGGPGASPDSKQKAGQAYVIFGSKNFSSPLELSSLNRTNGFIINGIATGDAVGFAVDGVGDVNVDGIDDIIIGAPGTFPNSDSTGQAYVIFGRKYWCFDILDLAQLNSTQGFSMIGASQRDLSGSSVSTVPDVNGDNIADILVAVGHSSPLNRTDAGEIYVVYGKKDGYPQGIDFNQLTNSTGFRIIGYNATQNSDWVVNNAGDVNHDGITDIVIGVNRASAADRLHTGAVYVIYGKKDGKFQDIDLDLLYLKDGFKILGANSGDLTGTAVAGNFDINADGIADLAIGASGSTSCAGITYVLYGRIGGYTNIDLRTIFADKGFRLLGANSGDYSGATLAGNFDINADGISDVAIGAYAASPFNRSQAGEVYILYGRKGGYQDIELSTFEITQGFKIFGANANDLIGSISSAGDINGDNITDVVIGASYASPLSRTQAGLSYVLYGKRGGYDDIDLREFNASFGFRIIGENSGDFSGISVKGIGDIDSDGIADILIGAKNASYPIRSQAGISYIVCGKKGGYVSDIDLNERFGDCSTKITAVIGANKNDMSGYTVSGGEDINADGLPDLVIGAPDAQDLRGQTYVLYGAKYQEYDLSGDMNTQVNLNE